MRGGAHDGSNRHDYFQGLRSMTGTVMQRIGKHSFVILLNQHGKSANEAWLAQLRGELEEGKWSRSPPQNLPPDQHYLWTVMQPIDALARAVQRLEESRRFMGAIETGFDPSLGIARSSAIEYHFAHYIVTLTGLFDILLSLTNRTFQLGVADRELKWGTIGKNRWVVITGIAKELDAIDRFLQKYRGMRNGHVHGGGSIDLGPVLDDPEYALYIMADFLMETFREKIAEDPALSQYAQMLVEAEFPALIKRVCICMDEDLERLWVLLDQFLSALLRVLKYWIGFNAGAKAYQRDLARTQLLSSETGST